MLPTLNLIWTEPPGCWESAEVPGLAFWPMGDGPATEGPHRVTCEVGGAADVALDEAVAWDDNELTAILVAMWLASRKANYRQVKKLRGKVTVKWWTG